MPWVFAPGTPRLSPNETASAGRLLWSLQMLWVVIGTGGDRLWAGCWHKGKALEWPTPEGYCPVLDTHVLTAACGHFTAGIHE